MIMEQKQIQQMYLHLCQVVSHQQTPFVRNVHPAVPESDGEQVTAEMVKTG